jgi:hypothetical protein
VSAFISSAPSGRYSVNQRETKPQRSRCKVGADGVEQNSKDLERLTLRGNAMLNANDSRTESSSPLRILAAAMFVVMVGSGYAVSTQVGAVDQAKVAIPAIPDQATTDYFPAQYVNQAKEVEQHIEAF